MGKSNNLGIRIGFSAPYKFDPELPEFSETAFLGAFVAETILKVEQFKRLWERLELVYIHPHNRSCKFRPEGHIPAPFVRKIIEFTYNTFSGLKGKKVQMLKRGRNNFAVSPVADNISHNAFH